jgi:hypothetical protein
MLEAALGGRHVPVGAICTLQYISRMMFTVFQQAPRARRLFLRRSLIFNARSAALMLTAENKVRVGGTLKSWFLV